MKRACFPLLIAVLALRSGVSRGGEGEATILISEVLPLGLSVVFRLRQTVVCLESLEPL